MLKSQQHARWRHRGRARKLSFMILLALYFGFICLSFVLKSGVASSGNDKEGTELELVNGINHNRYKRHARTAHGLINEEKDDNETDCTPRAAEEFPDNFFTLKETQDGGMAAHIALALYMFGTLAIVCDDYFVASLEVICDRLQLQEDVAGATFMAAGSSAPEFFTSVVGVFIAKSDVGVGTIVGSAVFNILFIIGVCGIFAGMIVKLTWYPMTRDCLFYLISIASLVIVINDEHVYWYEATVLVVLYVVYILVMYFNRTLEKKFIDFASRIRNKVKKPETFGKDLEASEEKQPLSDNLPSGTYTNTDDGTPTPPAGDNTETSFAADNSESKSGSLEDVDDYESPWTFPDSIPLRIYWIIMLPVKLLMFITIPDCRRSGILRRLYPFTFVMSIVWIAGASYLMVWMVTIVGDALGIPDTVMGLTILAAGTSVPDCLSSVFVARDGYGDMAVSNSIGSNVFDILMCLGLPWLLDTAILKKGDPLIINSGGILYSALILLSTVFFMLIAINLAKWKLTKPFGYVCLVVYCAVIAVSCLFELNVFGDFVLPPCDRT